ncbi:hypothetical protein [Mesomycoplasma ovipneumoniae]
MRKFQKSVGIFEIFLIFLAKFNNNFFTNSLKYQSKNHTPEFPGLMENSLFSEYKYTKMRVNPSFLT